MTSLSERKPVDTRKAARELNTKAREDFRPGHGQARSKGELAVAYQMAFGVKPRDERWQRLRRIFEC